MGRMRGGGGGGGGRITIDRKECVTKGNSLHASCVFVPPLRIMEARGRQAAHSTQGSHQNERECG